MHRAHKNLMLPSALSEYWVLKSDITVYNFIFWRCVKFPGYLVTKMKTRSCKLVFGSRI